MDDVKAWEELIEIPTYPVGTPEKNPMFLEKRIYQGSSGVVYPHAVIEKISDEKINKPYKAVFLENAYIKIMILPELGGRIQMAFDKVKQRHFVYYNQVIKPALVGLAGPWISGGIEFNWPQHHRPSTFDPVDFTIEENKDGSKTVWVNEVELMSRTKGMAGFTVYPGKAYLEIKARIFNRTPFPQTFLWWANPAVKVNDFHQSVFPPDVHAVFDHGKRDVSDFPIATGTYYKVNYAPGTDISMYKNIPVPTSYMAVQSKYNFIGCYEHDTKGGMLHVANHHVSTGKKQWTWGNGDFGQAWDRNLTDEDGPYIELMCGVFTDNQPDFSWLQPNEEKTFEQYFMPYAGIGLVKNASKQAAVNVEFIEKKIQVKVYATSLYENATISLLHRQKPVAEFTTQLSPENIFNEEITGNEEFDPVTIKVTVRDNAGNVLIEYEPGEPSVKEIPEPAKAAKKPAQIETNEQLFFTGLHLEQYRHATFSPTDYYREALRRDPTDTRCNNAMGLLLLRIGQFEKAAPYFLTAIKSLTSRNPNPYQGAPYFNLGICCMFLGHLDDAYRYLYKSTWNDECQHCAFLQLARIATYRNDVTDALYLVEKSLIKNYNSPTARHLKVCLLRKAGNHAEAADLAKASLGKDPFNYGCLFELYLLATNGKNEPLADSILTQFKSITREHFNNYLEYALDYAAAGCFTEAIRVLTIYSDSHNAASPMLYYYLGWFYTQVKDTAQSAHYYIMGSAASPDYCFPSKTEDKIVLESATSENPNDAKAQYYLGNYWYSKRQYTEAIECWKKSAGIDPTFPTVLRNLSLASYNKLNLHAESLQLLEKAFALDESDARVLMELDQLYKIENVPHKQRLELLEKHRDLVESRDDLYLERITLYNLLGNFEKAKELIAARKFHPWEGGEGRVVYQFLVCYMELAKKAILEGRNEKALQLLDYTAKYPENLGEGKLYGTQVNDINYLEGCAYETMGLPVIAAEKFSQATCGTSDPVQAIFYNDPQPDKIFYQGLAWKKLKQFEKAESIFKRLISFGEAHINDPIEIDYFAVSLPDLLVFDQDLGIKNFMHCHYMIGLGHLGLGDSDEAGKHFNRVLEQNIHHQGAAIHLSMIHFLYNQEAGA